MAIVTITMNIESDNYDDSSAAMLSLVSLLNKVKEQIRMTNYTLDKYNTQTIEVMDVNNRGMVTIIS